MNPPIARLLHNLEQEETQCQEWLRDATPDAIEQVWELINTKYDNPAMEVMSRFAQLGIMYGAALFIGKR